MSKFLLFVAVIISLVPHVHAAQRVPIGFDVPTGLESYTGLQPVTFGVPFPQGVLAVGDGLRVVDAKGAAVPCQFEVTGTWTAEGKHVRWLLVDTFADITDGNAAARFLEFGSDIKTIETAAENVDYEARVRSLGYFTLNTGDKRKFVTTRDANFTLERTGPVRTVAKITGQYQDSKGESIAEYVTRVRFYAGQSYARVYHTLIWLTGDETTIANLTFVTHETFDNASPIAGVDGKRVYPNHWGTLPVHQYDWDRVEGQARGKHLDGWIASTNGAQNAFAAVRWPWQQFPLGFYAATNGQLTVNLMDPAEPFSFKPTDVAVEGVMTHVDSWNLRIFKSGVPGNDVVWNGAEARPHVSPKGVSKTWEMLLWPGDGNITPEVKNTCAQEPVLAFADPTFAVQAELPSPSAAYDAGAFPEIESGIQRAFDHLTREQADYGDFGTFNYGDLQWNWTHSGVPIYRFWMNHGKGWSIAPWALWIRSGDRRYWDKGEANSRHAMDVDMCHVNNVLRDTETYKVRGGQYHYSALHWGYGPQHFSFFIDTEYLPYYWHMAGYERAHDVMMEHVEGLKNWEGRAGWMAHFHEDPKKNAGRHIFVMIKNLGAIYEATWDADVKALLDEVVDVVLKSQFESGNFPHVKTNHYLDQALAVGERVYGWDRFGDAIANWQTHLGDPTRPGPSGCVAGPESVWLAYLLYRQNSDRHGADAAAAMTMSQVRALVRDTGDWQGFSAMAAHEAGPIVRDWPIAIKLMKQAKITEKSAGRRPIAGFGSRLPVPQEMQREEWSKIRHVAMVLDENDAALAVDLNFRAAAYRVRIIAPDGVVMLDEDRTVELVPVAYEEALKQVMIPSDGKKGAYAIEVYIPGRDENVAPLNIVATGNKIVHLMPPGRRTFQASRDAGQFWFKAQPGAVVEFGWPVGWVVTGRMELTDEAGNVLAETHITQTSSATPSRAPRLFATGLPFGPHLRYQAPAEGDALLALNVAHRGDWHRWCEIKGNQPFIAAAKEQWFDPTEFPHPDLSVYLK